jgi:hypothetical protein
LQMFRYVTDAEAAAEKGRHEEELQKVADRRQKAAAPAPADKPTEISPKDAPDSPGATAAPAKGENVPSKPQN